MSIYNARKTRCPFTWTGQLLLTMAIAAAFLALACCPKASQADNRHKAGYDMPVPKGWGK